MSERVVVLDRRPDWIPREVFRKWLSRTYLNHYATVDGIQPASFVARCAARGAPLPCKRGQWRLIDIWCRARADAVEFGPNGNVRRMLAKAELERELAMLREEVRQAKHQFALNEASQRLTGATLLRESEIVAASSPLVARVGVYFLVEDARVVYVGQSVDVFKRIAEHGRSKMFSSVAFVECRRDQLDALESLYIHLLRPKLNGNRRGGEPNSAAPMNLAALLSSSALVKLPTGAVDGAH
jgi:hypothetical protein